ncbi:UNVERIFIED_CONTAM: ATP-binding cassette subfamily B protein [Acetivibrio alkalicellulosi]
MAHEKQGISGGRLGNRYTKGLIGPKEKAKNSKTTIKRLWVYLKGQKKGLYSVLLTVLMASGLNLAGPFLIGMAIDTMIGQEEVDFKRLSTITVILLMSYIFAALMTWLQVHIMVGVSQNTVREIRKDLFAKMQTLSLKFFNSKTHGELMSRLTNDVENINNSLSQSVAQVFTSVITIIGALILMMWFSPLLTFLSLISIPLGMVATAKIASHTRKHFASQQKELGQLNGFVEETISGQKVVKAFAREQKVIKEFASINEKLTSVGIRAQIFSGIIMPVMHVTSNLSFAIIAGAGGFMAARGIITVGIIASFINYSRQFTRPLAEIANQFNMMQSAIAGAERVFETMDEKSENYGENCKILKEVVGEVIFKDVTFGYEKDVNVLKNVNIKALPGETIALVGPTGAGKTTIVNLLTRFYDINKGTIMIDKKDIREIDRENLRRFLGIVLQDTYLFSSSIRENIRYGKLEASDEEVEAAAKLANAHSFIKKLPYGYDTNISEDGGNISQGQRQLLTIARAILADPAILILDEATSSVDTRTEMYIQEAMLKLMKGRTCFIIAHRLSTIRNANQILVINEGEIIERGSHRELLDAKGFYYKLYNNQFKRQVM